MIEIGTHLYYVVMLLIVMESLTRCFIALVKVALANIAVASKRTAKEPIQFTR